MALRLSLACSECDRTQGLRDGSVPVEGVSLTCIGLPVEEVFHRMARFAEFDAAELSLSSYVLSLQMGKPFIAVPAFPSRMFRHSGIYVNSDSGIAEPADLIGRTVGLAEYQLTANVWIRGILEEHYGVPVASVTYRTGGLHAPGRTEKLPLSLPDGIRVEPIGDRQTLAQMLVVGEIDALYTPRTPAPYAQGRPEVRRLFGDAAAEEARYFAGTGVFPIMHTVVLRRALYDEHRCSPGPSSRPSSRHGARRSTASTRPPPSSTWCRGCTRRSPGPGGCSATTTGPTACSRTCGPWTPSCGTPSSRAWPGAGSALPTCLPGRRLTIS